MRMRLLSLGIADLYDGPSDGDESISCQSRPRDGPRHSEVRPDDETWRTSSPSCRQTQFFALDGRFLLFRASPRQVSRAFFALKYIGQSVCGSLIQCFPLDPTFSIPPLRWRSTCLFKSPSWHVGGSGHGPERDRTSPP